jgi:mono/diheme cytochrome c family protein
MKRAFKWFGIVAAGLAVIVVIAIAWVELGWSVDHPDTPYPEIHASTDPAMIAHGEYIVNAVAHCSTCHGPYDPDAAERVRFGEPMVGGYVIQAGPFGTFTVPNLTPHASGIGEMTDAELARAIRHGIRRDGTLSPMMRFSVGAMADEDLAAVISYLRAQQPVDAVRAGPRYGFLGKALSKRFGPQMAEPPAYVPAGGISVERGHYLANGPAACGLCHTPTDPMAGFAPSGPAFSGAARPEPDPAMPGYEIIAPNITPGGILASWSEDQFVARMAAGRMVKGSIMPWEAFARMTEEDVRSVYRYLRTIDPVDRETGPAHRERGSFKG